MHRKSILWNLCSALGPMWSWSSPAEISSYCLPVLYLGPRAAKKSQRWREDDKKMARMKAESCGESNGFCWLCSLVWLRRKSGYCTVPELAQSDQRTADCLGLPTRLPMETCTELPASQQMSRATCASAHPSWFLPSCLLFQLQVSTPLGYHR